MIPVAFLSYSSQDRATVERVAEELRATGIETWLDRDQIVGGDRLVEAIGEGIARAGYCFLFWSATAARSRWVQSELDAAYLRWADARSLLLVPLRLDDTPLPELLKAISYLDFRVSPDDGIAQLRKFIGKEGFGSEQPPRLLHADPTCPERLGAMRNMELRLLLKSRCSLNDVREMWMDTFDSRLDDELPNLPLGLAIGELLLRADQRRVRSDLFHSICANRPDVVSH